MGRQGLPLEHLLYWPPLIGPEQLQGYGQGGGGALPQAPKNVLAEIKLQGALIEGSHDLPEGIFPREVLRHPGVQLRFGRNIPAGEECQHPLQVPQRFLLIDGKLPGTIFQRFPEFEQSRRRRQVGGQPQPDAFGPQEFVPGQGQVLGVARRTPGKEPAGGPHVREKADAGFGHGHAGCFGGHHDIRPGGQAQPASHGDAVGQDHHRLGKLVDQEVQGILFPEELVGQVYRAFPDRPGQFLEVASGAKAPVPGAVKQHQTDLVRGQGLFQGPAQAPDHFPVKGVEDPGAIEANHHQARVAFYEDGSFCRAIHFLVAICQ